MFIDKKLKKMAPPERMRNPKLDQVWIYRVFLLPG
jgi:hypothetical protein